MIVKNIYSIVAFTLLMFFSISQQAFSADIEWKVYLKSHRYSGPILSKITGVGGDFIINDSDFQDVPAECQNIVNALDGLKFLIQNFPASGSTSIYIVLNDDGNSFERVGGNSLFINLSFEAYINGEKQNDITFSEHSPLIMTIPQVTLSSLLATCELSRGNLICVYYSGGRYSTEGIVTNNISSGMEIKINELANVIGGWGNDFGFQSNTKIDTWKKIKLLFR